MSRSISSIVQLWGKCSSSRWATLAFMVVLGLIATYFLGEQIGKHSDDYFLGQRDVVTGKIVRWTLGDLDRCYWRPLHCVFTAGMQTVLWHHNWAVHLILSLTHVACATLLVTALRVAGCGWRPAAAAGVLFIAWPTSFEAFFWAAAWMTIWANVLFLFLVILQIRYAQRDIRPRWWWLAGAMIIGHAIPCANEQAMMGVLALPLLSLAVGGDQPARERWWRALSLPAAAGFGGLVYLALMFWTLRSGQRGETGTLAGMEQWSERAVVIARGAWLWLTLDSFGTGAFRTGLIELRGHPFRALAAACALGTASMWFVRTWMQVDASCSSAHSHARKPVCAGWLIAFGFGVMALDWVPVGLVKIYEAAPRLWYCPFTGLLIGLTAVFEMVGRQLAAVHIRGMRAISAAALMVVSLAGAIALIGVQAMYRERWRLDQSHLADLRRLAPDPAAGSVVLPLEVLCKPMHTGSRRFDSAAESPLSNPFVAPIFVRRAFGRMNVTAARPGGWGDPRILEADQRAGWWRRDYWNGTTGRVRIPWRLIIPVRIDADGRMHGVSRVRVERGGVEELIRKLPQVGSAETEWIFRLP